MLAVSCIGKSALGRAEALKASCMKEPRQVRKKATVVHAMRASRVTKARRLQSSFWEFFPLHLKARSHSKPFSFTKRKSLQSFQKEKRRISFQLMHLGFEKNWRLFFNRFQFQFSKQLTA